MPPTTDSYSANPVYANARAATGAVKPGVSFASFKERENQELATFESIPAVLSRLGSLELSGLQALKLKIPMKFSVKRIDFFMNCGFG